jgi:Holliday junction resolvase RusA-like endonuclease
MSSHYEYLERLAQSLLVGTELPNFPVYPAFAMELDGFVMPKQRPRLGAGGRTYTPKETRVFEQRVRDAAIAKMLNLGVRMFECPVTVHLEIRDQIPNTAEQWMRRLMAKGLVTEMTGGDLDNKEKAVLDAINGVVYRDDKQVIQTYKFRRYGEKAGFKLHVSPAGLTKADIYNVGKVLKHLQKQGNNGSQA